VDGWTEQLPDTYETALTVHLPGRVLADLAAVTARRWTTTQTPPR
jgi:hypothetical protein